MILKFLALSLQHVVSLTFSGEIALFGAIKEQKFRKSIHKKRFSSVHCNRISFGGMGSVRTRWRSLHSRALTQTPWLNFEGSYKKR